MLPKSTNIIRAYRFLPRCAVLACLAITVVLIEDAETNSDGTDAPRVIFSAPLPEVPGSNLVVVALKLPPKARLVTEGHRHPGSVYVHVTEGTARLGLEGQAVQQVQAGHGFFEPSGVLHTVGESASATEAASAIAVMIVPDGAPLVL